MKDTSLREKKALSFKNKLLSRKFYLLCGVLGFLFLFSGIIIYFLVRPERPEIPLVPKEGWAKDLIAYWAFDEKKGQIAYEASSRILNARLGAQDGRDEADPQRFKKGKIGRALKFDGQNDYAVVIDHPDLRISREITLEGWFKVLGVSGSPPQPIWLKNFQYRRQIIIDNRKSEESFQNTQVLIVIDTASLISQGKMQKECEDIRFTDSDETTLLFYWIERGCNTQETKIWVKVPQLPAHLIKSIYLYYGNLKAESVSDFYKTMETPPVKRWDYPQKEEALWGKQLKALAVKEDNTIIVVGGDNVEGNLQWRIEMVSPRGVKREAMSKNFSPGTDEINDVTIDFEGKMILGGYDSVPGNSQWRVEKEGGFTFTVNFSPGPDEIKAVAVDSQNNVILGGYDSLPGDAQWRLIKLTPEGEKLLEYAINPSDETDVIVDVKVDSHDNIVLAGYEKSLNNDRWRIEKLDRKGELLYSYRLDISEGADVINAIVIDSQDNVIAVGYDFFPGDAQWRVVKLDWEGKRIWQWSFNPSPGFDEAKAVDVDSEDNIIVAGYDSTAGDFAWWMIKFSPQGEKIWEWRYNPSEGFDELKDLVIDKENNIILGGYDFSLQIDPHWRVTKFSEKKPLFPQPRISLQKETIVAPLSGNAILLKPDSYQLSATREEIIGFIGKSIISAPLRNRDWNHFALTYDGVKLKLYLNGTLVNSQALTGEIATNFNNLFIGYNFSGLIDELKIYKRALSPEEVKFLYNKK